MAITFLQKKKVSQRGVTLIEMIVVVGIIAAVSAVLMFNYSNFSTNVSVRNLTQDIALATRKAQTYATSVRAIDGAGGMTSKAFPGYGISFSTKTGGTAYTPGQRKFVLFADSFTPPISPTDTNAGFYNAGASCGKPGFGNECLEVFTINSADRITEICVNISGSGTCTITDTVDITFRRPSPDACITTSANTNCSISNAIIRLESIKGLKRSVQIWNTGQISVQ